MGLCNLLLYWLTRFLILVTGTSSHEESSEGPENRRDESSENQLNSDIKVKEESAPMESEETSVVTKKEIKEVEAKSVV